jgi:hypothetical protein
MEILYPALHFQQQLEEFLSTILDINTCNFNSCIPLSNIFRANFPNGASLTYDGNTFTVNVPNSFMGRLNGLCGHFDGNPSYEYVARDGTLQAAIE